MNKQSAKSILEYWRAVEETPLLPIQNWLQKENSYLIKNIKKGSVVLDVGCGFGRNIKAISGMTKKIIGIDNNGEQFLKIKRNLSKFKNVSVFLEDAKKTHFTSNTFDYVICMGNTFGNFGKDKLKALKEMKRVAKKGGKIIVSVYSKNSLKIRIREYTRIGMPIKKVYGGTVYTKDSLILEQFPKFPPI